MKWLYILLLPEIFLVFTCTSSTDPIQGNNYLDYFPLGDNYTWKYEVKTSTFKNDTLTSSSTDTVYYSLKLDSIANNNFYYSLLESSSDDLCRLFKITIDFMNINLFGSTLSTILRKIDFAFLGSLCRTS